MKNTVVIIPARLESNRFPGKVLKKINGKPLIFHVLERIQYADVSEIIVATDSEEIRCAVDGIGGCRVEMTKTDHLCGTDRIAEVAANISADYILNVQGDELITGPDMINEILSNIDDDFKIGTLYTDFKPFEDIFDVNIVKVLTNRNGNMIYMSRTPIPFDRGSYKDKIKYYKQVGLYVFKRETLLYFSKLKTTRLELVEGIELLRALDYGIPLRGIYTNRTTCDVNIPEDIASAEHYVKEFKIS